MFIFYALFYLSDSLNNKHVSFTGFCALTGSLFDQTAAEFRPLVLQLLVITQDYYQWLEFT